MKKKIRVLMIEDMPPDVALIRHELRKAGFAFQSSRVETKEDLLAQLSRGAPDLILSDNGLPGFDGFQALAEAHSHCPDVPFIFVTGAHGEDMAVEAFRKGAADYVPKSKLHLLGPAI